MSDKTRTFDKIDMVKEAIWTIFLTAFFFVYWVVLLMIVTFLFNSIIKLTFEAILLISAFMAVSMLIYRIVRGVLRLRR